MSYKEIRLQLRGDRGGRLVVRRQPRLETDGRVGTRLLLSLGYNLEMGRSNKSPYTFSLKEFNKQFRIHVKKRFRVPIGLLF